jgi:hypothetical protein
MAYLAPGEGSHRRHLKVQLGTANNIFFSYLANDKGRTHRHLNVPLESTCKYFV